MSTTTLTAKQAFLLDRWQQILNDPELDQYENYRIETDADGNVLMSPRPPKPHNFKATKIAVKLVERLGGEASVEPQIITSDGVKVPDVCWLHPDRSVEVSDYFHVAIPDRSYRAWPTFRSTRSASLPPPLGWSETSLRYPSRSRPA